MGVDGGGSILMKNHKTTIIIIEMVLYVLSRMIGEGENYYKFSTFALSDLKIKEVKSYN